MTNANRAVASVTEEFLRDNRIEGARVLVNHEGHVVADVTLGNYDGDSISPDSIWWIASLTKPVIATAVLTLIDDGRLDLDAPISDFVPEFAAARRVRILAPGTTLKLGNPFDTVDPNEWVYEPANRQVTVRDFLTMTSGLQTITVVNTEIPQPTTDDTVESLVARLGSAPLDFQSGAHWHYSNSTGYEVLARVIEVVTDVPVAEYIQKKIFDPLEMTSTSFGVADERRDRVLPLGLMTGHPLTGQRFSSGSAGLFSTATDYAAFAEMLLNKGTHNGTQVVSSAAVGMLSSNQIGDLRLGGVASHKYFAFPENTNEGVAYGFGVLALVNPDAAGIDLPAGSFGWDGIGSRRFWVIPSLSMTILILTTGAEFDAFHRGIESAVRQAVNAS